MPCGIQIRLVSIQCILICLLVGRCRKPLPVFLKSYASIPGVQTARCRCLLINRLRPTLQIELIPWRCFGLRKRGRSKRIVNEVFISIRRSLPKLLIGLLGLLLLLPFLRLEINSSLLILLFKCSRLLCRRLLSLRSFAG